MKVQRTLPPSAAPIEWQDLLEGLLGLVHSEAAVERLQDDFRQHFGVKHVWFVSSGKAALSLILSALHGLSGRNKVVLPGYTCFSVPSAVVRARLSVALCDVDPVSLDFDFGRSSPDSGTYRFKEQWGAQPHQLYWYYWMKDGRAVPQLNPQNPKYALAIRLWQQLPVVVANVLGPYIVKHLP